MFGVKRFQNYLYNTFTLVTDHRPPMMIFGQKKGVHALISARIQRWVTILSAYQYNIEFRPTQVHANADGLSRLPLREFRTEEMSSNQSRMHHQPPVYSYGRGQQNLRNMYTSTLQDHLKVLCFY